MRNYCQKIRTNIGAAALSWADWNRKASRASHLAKAFIFGLTSLFIFPQRVYASAFITAALSQLGIVIIAIGGGLGIWGIVNLLEGYGNDNPGAKSQGIKQLMAGGGLILIGIFVPEALDGLFG